MKSIVYTNQRNMRCLHRRFFIDFFCLSLMQRTVLSNNHQKLCPVCDDTVLSSSYLCSFLEYDILPLCQQDIISGVICQSLPPTVLATERSSRGSSIPGGLRNAFFTTLRLVRQSCRRRTALLNGIVRIAWMQPVENTRTVTDLEGISSSSDSVTLNDALSDSLRSRLYRPATLTDTAQSGLWPSEATRWRARPVFQTRDNNYSDK